MNILTRKHFKLPPDPWAKLQLTTADVRRVGDMVEAAVSAQAFVSIIGERGSGKSHAIRTALARYDEVQVVEPLRLDRHRLTMNDIATAIVRDLSDEIPKHSGEARAYQVRRILGEITAPVMDRKSSIPILQEQKSVVLLIDDAHALHGQTLRALKRLREMAWLGRSPLLGIVLVGQRDKTAHIPEVGLRLDRLWIGGLSQKERISALSQLQPSPFSADALAAIAAAPAAQNWLDLQAVVDDCLLAAQADGKHSVSKQHVVLALGPSSRIIPSMQADAPSDAQISDYLASKTKSTKSSAVANG